MKRLLYSIFFLVLSASFIQAQFNWQGVLRNDQNTPMANQDVSVQLTILQNGTMVFRETHSTTTSDIGLMNLQVCTGTNVSGDCNTLDWSLGSYMMNVAVDVDGGSNYDDYGSSPILMVPMSSYSTLAQDVVNDNVDDADADPENEIQRLEFDNPTRQLSITGVQGFIRIPSTGGDGDPDPNNEIQELAKNSLGEIILQRAGGLIVDGKVTDEVDDDDADPENEIQELALNGTDLSISDGNTVSLAGLGGGGPTIWTKANNNIFYETGAPGNRIEFGPGIFSAGMSGAQGWKIDSRSNRATEEFYFTTPNSGRRHAIGRYIQDFPVPDFSQLYCRFEGDTTFDVRTQNFTGEVRSILTLAGSVMNTRVIAFQLSTGGGFGTFIQTVGNQVGVRMGILTGGVPFVGIASANNPNQITAFMDRNRIVAPVKNFVMDHPKDASKQIWYACVEGPEAAAYERGTAQLVNGEAFIPFSDHFELIINPETMTVNLTPNSAESLGLAVVEKTEHGIRVKELYKGSGNYSFDWEAKAVRKGYENYRVVRDKTETVIQEEIDLN